MPKKKLLTVVECTTDFPDDYVEDEAGMEIVRVGGVGIATALVALLEARGMKVTQPSVDDEHGWCFDVSWKDRGFWVLVADAGPECIISTEETSKPIIAWLLGRRQEYREFLEILHDVLSTDVRFHDLKWYPRLGPYNEENVGATPTSWLRGDAAG